MPEEVRQSTGSQSVNADRTNNSVRNSVRKPIQMNTAALFNNYKERGVANDFSKQSQEAEQKLQKGMDI